jgi:hypothetical protein
MSRHHIMPPAVYTPPPPKKIETKKRRIGIGSLSEFDAAEEAHGTSETGQSAAPVANKPLQQNFSEIEDASRKPRGPSGRLSQTTLSALLRAQELE